MNNPLSLAKIISGLSKTLTIANKLIPLYKEVKPYINKTNNFISNLNKSKQSNTSNTSTNTTTTNNTNLPTFFQ